MFDRLLLNADEARSPLRAGYEARTGLILFGILEIVPGILAALMIPLMILGQAMAARTNQEPTAVRQLALSHSLSLGPPKFSAGVSAASSPGVSRPVFFLFWRRDVARTRRRGSLRYSRMLEPVKMIIVRQREEDLVLAVHGAYRVGQGDPRSCDQIGALLQCPPRR